MKIQKSLIFALIQCKLLTLAIQPRQGSFKDKYTWLNNYCVGVTGPPGAVRRWWEHICNTFSSCLSWLSSKPSQFIINPNYLLLQNKLYNIVTVRQQLSHLYIFED